FGARHAVAAGAVVVDRAARRGGALDAVAARRGVDAAAALSAASRRARPQVREAAAHVPAVARAAAGALPGPRAGLRDARARAAARLDDVGATRAHVARGRVAVARPGRRAAGARDAAARRRTVGRTVERRLAARVAHAIAARGRGARHPARALRRA